MHAISVFEGEQILFNIIALLKATDISKKISLYMTILSDRRKKYFTFRLHSTHTFTVRNDLHHLQTLKYIC